MVIGEYTNDLGVRIHNLPLNFFIKELNNQSNTYLFNEIAPQLVLDSLISSTVQCSTTGFTLRRLEIKADDTNVYQMNLAYKGGTQEFLNVIQQLNESSLVQSYRVLGESIKYNKLIRYGIQKI